jgi:hypothetical protein
MIALIIFRNGNHELFVHPSQASDVLGSVASLVNLYNETHTNGSAVPGNSGRVNKAAETRKLAEKTEVKAYPEANEKEPAKPPKEKEAKVQQEKPSREKQEKARTVSKGKEVQTAPPVSEAVKMDSAGYLTHAGMMVFNARAMEKARELGMYMSKITDKNTDSESADLAITKACNLFVNDDARVEESKSDETAYKVKFKIREYLNRLKSMKYSQAKVVWVNVNYVSHLQKGVDGSYSGVITLQQKLQGISAESARYSEQVKTNMEVVLRNDQKADDGKNSWEVVLSDIGVAVIK